MSTYTELFQENATFPEPPGIQQLLDDIQDYYISKI